MSSLDQTKIAERLLQFVNGDLLHGADDPVSVGDDLLTSGRVDSMGIMRVVGFVEESFGVSVPPEDVTIDHFVSIQAIVNYVVEKQVG